MSEVWLPVLAYSDLYEVSSLGRVRRGARPMAGYVDRYGYRTVLLSRDGRSRRHKVHRLVCEAFHGRAPTSDHEVGHLNGDKTDNLATNLGWVTRAENTRQQIEHGTFGNFGGKHATLRLTDAEVSAIRADAISGMGGRRIAAKYGIARSTAHRITRGQSRVNCPQGDAQ